MLDRIPQIARYIALSTTIVVALSGASKATEVVSGAGSTFVAPVIDKWAVEYAKSSGVRVEYQSVGSGAGIQKIRNGEVDFGASDRPLDPAELAKNGLCQFPLVIGGVVPVVNLPGIAPGTIKFSGKLLGDIYLGKVTRWDDGELRVLNPGLQLPALPIVVVHRSDSSGTTFNWVHFLSATNPDWKHKAGEGLSVVWPTGVGGEGNAGVAAAVKETKGTIGYVEYAYAVENRLAYGRVRNAFSLFVSPSPESFQAAAESVDWTRHEDFSVVMTGLGGPPAYPITATTFILMPKSPKNAQRSLAALAFFKWALEHGDQSATELNYVSLPPLVAVQVEKYWSTHIKGASALVH